MECHGEEEKDFLMIKIQGSLVVPILLDQVIADESNEDSISLWYGAWMVTPANPFSCSDSQGYLLMQKLQD